MSQLPNRDEAQDESITEESPFPAQLLQNSQSIAISRSPIAQSHFNNNTTSSTPYTSQTLHSAHNSSKQTPDRGTSGGLDPPNTADMDGDSSKDLFELYGENSSLREELEKLKPEKMRLETQVNNQEAHIEVVEEENKRLKEVNDRLQTSYTELEADTTAKIEEFEKLEQAHNSLLGQVNGTDRKKGKIENILKDTKRSLQVRARNSRAMSRSIRPHFAFEACRLAKFQLSIPVFINTFTSHTFGLAKPLLSIPYFPSHSLLLRFYLLVVSSASYFYVLARTLHLLPCGLLHCLLLGAYVGLDDVLAP